MFFDYDVVIVGAGPIGSTLAYKLAKNNINVCLIDKKTDIGVPLQCAGIVSKEILNLNPLSEDIILNEVKGAYLNSPNNYLEVHKNNAEAYIIDRIAYDKFLLDMAINNGVTFKDSFEVNKIDKEKGIVYGENEEISSKIIVASDGANSIISKQLGNKQEYYYGMQFLIDLDYKFNNDDYVHLFTYSKVLPGFIWLIPLKENKYRIGLFSNMNFKEEKEFLTGFIKGNSNFKDSNILEEYYGKIPIYDKNNILVSGRVALIGDAASQVKPTSGGGLILGFNGVNILEEAIIKALETDDYNVLKDYEKEFKNKYNKELNIQLKVHNTLNLLSDNDLDYLFMKLKDKNAEELINKYGDMDKQSVLVKEFIKNGYLFKIFPKILFKKISSIWGVKNN